MTCLSPREAEVLTYLAEGASQKETARLLNISPSAVHSYVARARCKFHTKYTIVAIIRAVQAGLVVK